VKLTGGQTITGFKSVPTPTANEHIARKDYVDTITGTLANLLTIAKTNLVAAINELFTAIGLKADKTSVDTGWSPIADAWVYLSADAPTFVVTVPAGALTKYVEGMRVRLTQTTVKYFLCKPLTDTTILLYGGTDYTLANAAISAISFSMAKAPVGFPINPEKWSIVITDSTDRTQVNPVNGTIYNLGTGITLPIGSWRLAYELCLAATHAGSTALAAKTSLSTSPTVFDLSTAAYLASGSAGAYITQITSPVCRHKNIAVAVKTPMYLLAAATTIGTTNLIILNSVQPAVIEAVSNYL
jgi:hypothetical protein